MIAVVISALHAFDIGNGSCITFLFACAYQTVVMDSVRNKLIRFNPSYLLFYMTRNRQPFVSISLLKKL